MQKIWMNNDLYQQNMKILTKEMICFGLVPDDN